MLAHPKSDAPLYIMVDASDVEVGGVFQQHVEGCLWVFMPGVGLMVREVGLGS